MLTPGNKKKSNAAAKRVDSDADAVVKPADDQPTGDQPDFTDEDMEIADSVWAKIGEEDGVGDEGDDESDDDGDEVSK